jgi:hypothetical protein
MLSGAMQRRLITRDLRCRMLVDELGDETLRTSFSNAVIADKHSKVGERMPILSRTYSFLTSYDLAECTNKELTRNSSMQ